MTAIDFPNSPTTNQTFTAGGVTWRYDGTKWGIDAVSGPSYVTSLPGSPVDGQEVYYAADATNGVIWHLRYRSGASGSYKWEFVGGSALTATVLTAETRTNAAYGDLTTVGPSITNPLAGDYEISHGITASSSSESFILASLNIGGTISDNESVAVSGSSGATLYSSPARTVIKTGIAASTTIKQQYVSGAHTGTFLRRWLTVRPIRVG